MILKLDKNLYIINNLTNITYLYHDCYEQREYPKSVILTFGANFCNLTELFNLAAVGMKVD